MISPTSSPGLFGIPAGGTATTAAPSQTLDKDAFLKLFVAQLKNQDPMSPLQPYELAAQLAQFTSVEQLTQLNTAVAAQTAATQQDALINQATLSTSLFGKTVIAAGDQVTIPATGQGKIHVEVGGTGGAAQFQLLDPTGAVIATRDLGPVSQGQHDLTLPSNLPPGDYHYALKVTDSSQKDVAVTTYTSGVVTAVGFNNGALELSLGNLQIAFSDIAQVLPGGSTSGGDLPPATPPTLTMPPGSPVLPGQPDPGSDIIPALLGGRH